MVTKSKGAGAKKKGKVKVGKLEINKETVKDLTDSEKQKVQGGRMFIPSNDTCAATCRDWTCRTC